jgi:RimJ/RimL family protein N-acetyltransferase
LCLDGRSFRLRPIELSDADFVVALRSEPRAEGLLHPISGLVADQVAWHQGYLLRPDDWYWIVERRLDGAPEGTVGIWGVDRAAGRAEWGRWILRSGSPAAPESALLLYSLAFDLIGLSEVYCRTVATNAAVLSFHDRTGLERVGNISGAFELGATRADAVQHRLLRERWPTTRAILQVRAEQVSQLLERGARR